ncbi:hypothetical protein MASR2M15_00050 [Anaerolineales bacterium]
MIKLSAADRIKLSRSKYFDLAIEAINLVRIMAQIVSVLGLKVNLIGARFSAIIELLSKIESRFD